MTQAVMIVLATSAADLAKLGVTDAMVKESAVAAPTDTAKALTGLFQGVPDALREAAKAMEQVG